jgi:hypothetical protein
MTVVYQDRKLEPENSQGKTEVSNSEAVMARQVLRFLSSWTLDP